MHPSNPTGNQSDSCKNVTEIDILHRQRQQQLLCALLTTRHHQQLCTLPTTCHCQQLCALPTIRHRQQQSSTFVAFFRLGQCREHPSRFHPHSPHFCPHPHPSIYFRHKPSPPSPPSLKGPAFILCQFGWGGG